MPLGTSHCFVHTKMVVTHAGVPADSPGAAGWNMALDKLTALLETRA